MARGDEPAVVCGGAPVTLAWWSGQERAQARCVGPLGIPRIAATGPAGQASSREGV
ncbi:hypothetical protein PZA11_006574 [Diplocarpon coronariae]